MSGTLSYHRNIASDGHEEFVADIGESCHSNCHTYEKRQKRATFIRQIGNKVKQAVALISPSISPSLHIIMLSLSVL